MSRKNAPMESRGAPKGLQCLNVMLSHNMANCKVLSMARTSVQVLG
jgi:hypothetical protein